MYKLNIKPELVQYYIHSEYTSARVNIKNTRESLREDMQSLL